MLAHEGLGKEVSDVVRCGHERHAQLAVLDTFSYEIVPALNVLCLGMMFRVVREVDGRLKFATPYEVRDPLLYVTKSESGSGPLAQET